MKDLGVVHRLDEGFIEFSDGTRKSISNKTYVVELTFGQLADAAMVTSHPALRMGSQTGDQSVGTTEPGVPDTKRHKSATPQHLVWQRLGCPNTHVWTHVTDVLSDHGLPPLAHLKHDFQTSEAVALAREHA